MRSRLKRAVILSWALLACACGADSPTTSPSPSPSVGPDIPAANRSLVDPALRAISADSLARCTRDLAAIPSRNVGDPGAIEARDYLVAELRRAGWQVSLRPFDARGVPGDNVVADWRGLDAAAAVVIVSAHYDTVDGGHAGANDNGAGSAALVAIAQGVAAARGRFRRGIRLVAFSAEELGLVGSAAYVGDLVPDSVLADVNLDGIAPRFGQADLVLASVDPPFSQWLVEYTRRVISLHAAATGIGSLLVYDNHQWRTDTNSFWSRGVSGIWMLGSGDYPYANTPQDTLDKVDFEYGTRVARVAAAVALNLAEPVAAQ
jgi:hypothetical protein